MGRIEARIKLIKTRTENRDLPSALKAFKKFTRGPFSPMIELEGRWGNITNADEARDAIYNHIGEILYVPEMRPFA